MTLHAAIVTWFLAGNLWAHAGVPLALGACLVAALLTAVWAAERLAHRALASKGMALTRPLLRA